MRSFVPVQPVRRIAPAVLTLILSTVATATLCPSVASAQDGGGRTMRRISIAADTPLAAALQQIQAESGTTISYDPDMVGGLGAKAVRGARTARDAVLEAIAGTTLAVRVQSNGSLLVFRGSAADSGDILVIAQRDEAETNYNVNKATSSSRTGQTLKDIPQSTSVISDKLIRDQQAQTVLDAMRNAGGVAATLGLGGGPPGFLVRGYSSGALNNGLSSPAAANAPVAAVERIEVIRGPVALLSGSANYGGTVNIVPKKPTATPLLNVALEYQSFDDKKVTIDASNAVTSDRALSARFIGQYEDSDRGPGGYDGRYERLFAPSLRYMNAVADITVGVNISEVYMPRSESTIYDNVAKRPRTDVASPIGPSGQGAEINSSRFFFDSSFIPAPWLTLVARGEHYKVDQAYRYQFLFGAPDATGETLAGDNYGTQADNGESLDAYARFKFETGPFRHTLVAGVNYTDIRSVSHFADMIVYPLNVFQPGQSTPAAEVFPSPNAIQTQRTTGLYVQELVELGPLHLSAGLRRSRYKNGQTSPLYDIPGVTPAIKDEVTSTVPNFGAVFDITSNLSVYGNYLKGYLPVTLLDCSGNRAPDQQSRNVEGGVKADLLGRNISIVASVYDIRSNVRFAYAPPPCLANRTLVIPGGLINRGVELTATGSPLPGLNINASYSYQKITYRNPIIDPAYPEYNQVIVPGVSEHSYSLFAAYERPSKGQIKLGGALGISGNSGSFADGGATKPIPGGAQIDTNLYVTRGRTRLNLGVRNIFDKTLYSPTTVDFYIPVREGRRVIATLSHAFF
jgi:iron complex outermembrane receptor protein